MLIALSAEELDEIVRVRPDGTVWACPEALSRRIADALDMPCVPSLAISSCDYDQETDGSSFTATRSASGIWWVPDEHDDAIVGAWRLVGQTLTVDDGSLTDSPISYDESLIDRATLAVAGEDGSRVSPGHAEVVIQGTPKPVRVFAIRDPRITRVDDLLSPEERTAFEVGELGVATVLLLGGGKALVRRHGC